MESRWSRRVLSFFLFSAVLAWLLLVDRSVLLRSARLPELGLLEDNVRSTEELERSPSRSSLAKETPKGGLSGNQSGDEIRYLRKYQMLRQQAVLPSKQLPTALIIGVKKGGTRALLEFLRLHPAVRAAGSEVHFFDHHYLKGFHWYRRRMPATMVSQITMEKTPSYFVTSEVPRRVQRMNPEMKLILVVRDPVTRAISDYTQAKSKRSRMPRFEELAFLNGSKIVDTSWVPLKIGVYARHLERWLQYFPLSQFLFVSGERLIVDPVLEVTRVQNFLGLKRVICEKHFYFNATKGFPCLLKSEERPTPHCLGKNKGRSHPYIDPVAIQRLRDFYRPFNQKFYQLTGMDFGWL